MAKLSFKVLASPCMVWFAFSIVLRPAPVDGPIWHLLSLICSGHYSLFHLRYTVLTNWARSSTMSQFPGLSYDHELCNVSILLKRDMRRGRAASLNDLGRKGHKIRFVPLTFGVICLFFSVYLKGLSIFLGFNERIYSKKESGYPINLKIPQIQTFLQKRHYKE